MGPKGWHYQRVYEAGMMCRPTDTEAWRIYERIGNRTQIVGIVCSEEEARAACLQGKFPPDTDTE